MALVEAALEVVVFICSYEVGVVLRIVAGGGDVVEGIVVRCD